MLSIVDIKKELGKNIYIYPLNTNSIKSNSIDLHASKFAWSVSTKKSLVNANNQIVIPAHDTALIYSQEAIYVSNKIGGTYHSKVRLVSQGLGHIGTTLDAQYIGLSIVAIHNISDEQREIIVGSEFVTISFYYLHQEDYADVVSHDNPPGHPALLAGFENLIEYQQWEEVNRWCRSKKDLYMQMTQSEEYKKCKLQFEQEQILFNRKFWKKKSVKYVIILVSWLIVNGVLSVPAYVFSMNTLSQIATVFIENVSIPLVVSLIIPNLISDLGKR